MGIIGGIVQKKERRDNTEIILKNMLEAQKHRDGKFDFNNIFVQPGYAFGMVNSQNAIFEGNKLDCVETSKKNSRGDIYAYVDGMVLDVPKHKKAFEDSGISIPHATCSAIVVAAYKKWGIDFMDHLEGEFACAVWDEKEKKLLLSRDPYGHKPVHYYMDDGLFAFSSEIKGILASGIHREIDLIGLSDFLSMNCIPYPGTIFKNIKQVDPGSILIYQNNEIKYYYYCLHKYNIDNSITEIDAIAILEDKIRSAIKKRMITDSTYCFLSGGIDSSALVSFASELSSKPIDAVSVSFDEGEVNEFEFAKIMADHVGARLHHVIAKPESFFDMLETLVFHQDSPFTDTSSYPTYYAGKLGRQFTDVIMTGDGPDQTMGGSGHHVYAVNNNMFDDKSLAYRSLNEIAAKGIDLFSKSIEPSAVSKIKRKLYRNSFTPVHAAYDLRSYFPDVVKRRICSDSLWKVHLENNPYRHPETWFDIVKGEDDVNKYLYADIRFYVTDDLMIKVDRNCMAHNLETLSPFQDVQLEKIVSTLPGKYKVHVDDKNNIITKYILKKVCERRFPKSILDKKKQGFAIPLDKWLRMDNGVFLRETLLNRKALNRGYFQTSVLEKYVNDYINKKGDYFYANGGAIVALLTLELWHKLYIDK